MPGLLTEPAFKRIVIHELHPTFAAEVRGVDFSSVDDEMLAEIRAAMAKYGVCVFRSTGMDDAAHVAFSRRLGDLDDIRRFVTAGRKLRYSFYELFDAGNMDEEGQVLDPDSPRAHSNLGNRLFHTDSSFNPRRASFSLLRAVELPPPGTGGATDFADSRTAFAELPADVRADLLARDLVGCHTFAWSRKMGSPAYYRDLDPAQFRMARHRVAQVHEPSGRVNLYAGAHLHHFDGLPADESDRLRDHLHRHVTQDRYVASIEWESVGDMVIWDNRAVLHRAVGGDFDGKYRRDMRRTTVHDDSSTAWGLNEVGEASMGFATQNGKVVPASAVST